MPLVPLASIAHRIRLGHPLDLEIRDPDGTLLLARGQRVPGQAQLQALLERGAGVDPSQLLTPLQALQQLPRHLLPAQWGRCLGRVAQALQQAPHPRFESALDEAAQPVLALIERDPDLAIFQVLRQDACADVAYGVRRSLHSGIAAWLVAQRLGWAPADAERAFKVALTMNVSMLALQGELATQPHPPSPAQREALRAHPRCSSELLAAGGVRDADWLHGVERHHEVEDGSGYPRGCTDVGELASLARRVDVYTAKLASRAARDALAADRAGRQMFMQDPGHPMTAALVKEFGIYPPGCCVRLASGATGIVVERGPLVTTPVVALLTRPDGTPLPLPERADTAQREHAIVAVLGQRSVDPRITAEKLLAQKAG